MTALEIKVTVDLLGLPGAIHDLAEAMRGSNSIVAPTTTTNSATMTVPTPKPAPAVPTPEPAPAVPTPEPAPAVPTPEPVPVVAPTAPEAPVQEATPEPATTPAPAKEYTFKQISTAGAKLCSDQAKMNQLIDLLNSKYGAPAITMIDKSRYPELAEDLIKLGAVIEEE